MTSNQITHSVTTRYRYPLLLAAGLVMLACMILLSRQSPYHPGLSPVQGYEMRNATAPVGLVAGYIREAQTFLDITPCTYEIWGWAPDSALYYLADCDGQLQVWRVDPVDLASAGRVAAAPGRLTNATVARIEVLDRVYVPTVRPASVEPWVREVHLRSLGYPSPDGHWWAFVAERVYGPQDVLLLSQAR